MQREPDGSNRRADLVNDASDEAMAKYTKVRALDRPLQLATDNDPSISAAAKKQY